MEKMGGAQIFFFPEPSGLCTVALLAAIYSPNLGNFGKFSNFSPQRFRKTNFAGGAGLEDCHRRSPIS